MVPSVYRPAVALEELPMLSALIKNPKPSISTLVTVTAERETVNDL